jgi:hypothetical protein
MDAADDGKDGRGGADAQRQNADGRNRESAIAAEIAKPVTKIA